MAQAIDEIRVFQNIKCIISVREQSQFMGSIYAQWSDRVKRPGQKSFDAFIDQASNAEQTYLRYDLWFEELAKVVGEGNVLVLPIEDIKQKKYWDLLSEFVGVDAACRGECRNKRASGFSSWKLRPRSFLRGVFPRNRYTNRMAIFHERFISAGSISLSDSGMKKVQDLYRQGNGRLFEMTGVDYRPER